MNITTETVEAVWTAYVDTDEQAGPLPDRIEDMPDHTAKHYSLMRHHCPWLAALTDAEITTIVAAT